MVPRGRNRSEEAARLLDGDADGIQRLPDDILKHPFFYLTFEESLSLSVVSNTWQRIYKSLPVFEFRFDILEANGCTLEDLLTSVNKSLSVLKNHRAMIQSFDLNIDMLSEEKFFRLKPYLHVWLSLILKNPVKALQFRVSNSSSSSSGNNIYFTLPRTIFSSKSLVKLHLEGCRLPHNITPLSNDDDRRNPRFHLFNCLKEISLVDVVARLGQIQQLINLARGFLETLIIKTSPPLKFLNIGSFPMLDSIEANVKTIFVIRAMRLNKVALHGIKRASFYRVDNIRTLRFVKWERTALPSIQRFISCLRFLETLELVMSHNQRLRIQSPSLRTMELCECERFEQPLVVDIFSPQLTKIKSTGFSIPTIFTMFGWNQDLQFHHFGNPGGGGLHGSQLHMLGMFSRNSMQLKVKIHLHQILMIDENGENVVKTLEELREEQVPHASNVKMLVLESVPAASDYSSFLDALFWSCRPKTLFLLLTTDRALNSPYRAPFIAYLVDELLVTREKKAEACCPENNRPKCWRHYLADVKLELYKSTHHFEAQEVAGMPLQMAQNGAFTLVQTPNKGIVARFRLMWLPHPV